MQTTGLILDFLAPYHPVKKCKIIQKNIFQSIFRVKKVINNQTGVFCITHQNCKQCAESLKNFTFSPIPILYQSILKIIEFFADGSKSFVFL